MAPKPLTVPASRLAAASPSLEGLERVVHSKPQPSPNKSMFAASQNSSSSDLNKPLPPSCRSSGRPSFSSSRKSSSSAVNKPLPPSPPPQLFSPSPSIQVSPQSRSPGTLSGRGPTPQSAGFKPPPPFSAAVNAGALSKIESYPGRPEYTREPFRGTPLLAPTAQVMLAPNMQEERLQAFETYATFTPSELTTPFPEHVPQLDGQLQTPLSNISAARKQSVPYRFDTTADKMQGSQESFVRPSWASETDMSTEDVATQYQQTLPPLPFVTTDRFDGLEDSEDTPTRPQLPLLPATSYFASREELVEDDILTPRVPSAAAAHSFFVGPLSSPHSSASSHEESYRASRFDTPISTPRQPGQTFLSPQSDYDSSRQSSVDQGTSGSQASWGRGDDQSFMREDIVSPLDDDEQTTSLYEAGPRPQVPRPQFKENVVLQGIPPAQEAPGSRSVPRAPRTPILRAIDPSTSSRQSALQLDTTTATFGGLTPSTDPTSLNSPVSASSEYTDDVPSLAPMSRFSDDSDTEQKKKNRRSNPLTHLRKALGHRKTNSGSSSGSHRQGASAESVPSSPKQSKGRPQHTRGQSLGKMGAVAAQRIDDELGDMYETLSRFSWDANAGKGGKGREREREPQAESKPAPTHADGAVKTPRTPKASKTPKTPKIAVFMPSGGTTTTSSGGGGPAKLRKRSDTVARSPEAPKTPAAKRTTMSPITSPTWRLLKGDADEDGNGEDEGKSEGWLARRRRKKDEAKKEKWREDMKSKIKIVSGEPQGMMAIVATRNRNMTEGGML